MGAVIRPASGPIHLDTSFLIRALDPTRAESETLLEWLGARHALAVSAIAWTEFLCGPLGAEEEQAARVLVQRVVPIDERAASEAARLFNHAGRRRHSLPDCLVAAIAILDGASLATSNPQDFERFAAEGLELAG